jgi:endonuclease IV
MRRAARENMTFNTQVKTKKFQKLEKVMKGAEEDDNCLVCFKKKKELFYLNKTRRLPQ